MDWVNAKIIAWDRMRSYWQRGALGQITVLYLIAAQAASLRGV